LEDPLSTCWSILSHLPRELRDSSSSKKCLRKHENTGQWAVRSTSDAISSSPENCLQVSLSMMFCTWGSISAKGAYKTLFCDSAASR
jgi:hypothetical protein